MAEEPSFQPGSLTSDAQSFERAMREVSRAIGGLSVEDFANAMRRAFDPKVRDAYGVEPMIGPLPPTTVTGDIEVDGALQALVNEARANSWLPGGMDLGRCGARGAREAFCIGKKRMRRAYAMALRELLETLDTQKRDPRSLIRNLVEVLEAAEGLGG